MKNYLSCLLISLFLASCASVSSSYVPELVLSGRAKEDAEDVEYLARKPCRVALRIGSVSSCGNGYAGFDDLILDAKSKAAEMGGDFILSEKSGVEKNTIWIPASSTYDSSSNANWGSKSGQGSSQTTARSTGPSAYTVHNPWSVFSVWVYAPAQTGLRMNEDHVVQSFHLNSDALMAGVRVGDQLIGIDGIDIGDERIFHHILAVQPGDKLRVTLLRGSERLERKITAVPNT